MNTVDYFGYVRLKQYRKADKFSYLLITIKYNIFSVTEILK